MKKQISEVYWIRGLACLSVVFIHALTRTMSNYELPASTVEILKIVQISLMFATPMFILIFEVILGNAYWDRSRINFLEKDFRFYFYLILLFLLSMPFLIL